MVVKEVMAQVQAELIDMRPKLDVDFVWILHLKNHFSKFSMLYALKSKKVNRVHTLHPGLFLYMQWQLKL